MSLQRPRRIFQEPLIIDKMSNSCEIVYEVETLKMLQGHSDVILSFFFQSPSHVVTSSKDRTIRKFDMETLNCVETLNTDGCHRRLTKLSCELFLGLTTESVGNSCSDKVSMFSFAPMEEKGIIYETSSIIQDFVLFDGESLCLLHGNEVHIFSISENRARKLKSVVICSDTKIKKSIIYPHCIYFTESNGFPPFRLIDTEKDVEVNIFPSKADSNTSFVLDDKVPVFEVATNPKNEEILIFSKWSDLIIYNMKSRKVETEFREPFGKRISHAHYFHVHEKEFLLVSRKYHESETIELRFLQRSKDNTIKIIPLFREQVVRCRFYHGQGLRGIQLIRYEAELGYFAFLGYHLPNYETGTIGRSAINSKARCVRVLEISGLHVFDFQKSLIRTDEIERVHYFLTAAGISSKHVVFGMLNAKNTEKIKLMIPQIFL